MVNVLNRLLQEAGEKEEGKESRNNFGESGPTGVGGRGTQEDEGRLKDVGRWSGRTARETCRRTFGSDRKFTT